jgi:hypothetical protein
MKKTITLLFIYCISLSSFSQEKMSINTVLDYFSKSQLFVECHTFKRTVESQTQELSRLIKTEEDAQLLKQNYDKVWFEYDLFLKGIKQNMIGLQSFQNQDNQFVEVKNTYQEQFLPYYESKVGGKAISEELLTMGVGLVKNLIVKLKEKRFDKKEVLNGVLGLVNQRFYDQLKLKTYSQLDLKTHQTGNSQISNQLNNEPLVIPPSTLGAIKGSIKFVDPNGLPFVFIFQNTGKDIEIESDSTSQKIEDNNNQTSANGNSLVFISELQLQEGQKFKIEANSDCFTYCIVLNSNGVILLHPNVKYKTQGKDIEITSESTPTVGLLTIPTSSYFTIVPNKINTMKTTEDMAILFTNTELIMEDTIERLNLMEGSLEERIGQVFGNVALNQFLVNQNGDSIQFESPDPSIQVIPLVFKIQKM